MGARTIPWETIADWYTENEQAIRDVMKFEGLRGAVNEVLRIAPEQPELAELQASIARLTAEVEHWRDRSNTWKSRVSELDNEIERLKGISHG